MATCLLAMSLSAIAVVYAAHQGQERRSAGRVPQQETPGDGKKPVALWQQVVDTVGDRTHDVVVVIPLAKNAAPPPGLSRWPESGEAFLSPGLVEAGRGEGVTSRYGRFAGVISKEGLESPGERLAYVHPAAGLADREDMWEVTGFGQQGTGFPLGRHAYVFGVDRLYWGLFGLAVVPSLLLAAVAARGVNAFQEREGGAARVARGGRRSRFIAHVWRTVALGTAASCAVNLCALFTDLHVPAVDFVLDRDDVRSVMPLVGAAHLLTLLTVLGLLVVPRRRLRITPKPSRRRIAPHLDRIRSGCCRLFFLALLVTVRGTELAPESTRLTVYLTSLAITMVCAPAALATTLKSCGDLLVRAGRRRGAKTARAMGVLLKRPPLPLTALVSAVVVSIMLAGQVLLWNGVPGDLASQAQSTRERVGTSIVEVSGHASADGLRSFERALPDKAMLLAVHDRGDDGRGNLRVELVGSCEALRELAAPCSTKPKEVTDDGGHRGDARLEEFMRWNSIGPTGGTLTASHGSLAREATGIAGPVSLIVLGSDGASLSVPDMKRLAYRHLSASNSVDTPGGTWIVGAGMSLEASQWALLLSFVMVFCMAAVAAPVAAGRKAVPLTLCLALFILLLTAAGIGEAVASWLASPMDSRAWPTVTINALAPLTYAVAAGAGLITVGALRGKFAQSTAPASIPSREVPVCIAGTRLDNTRRQSARHGDRTSPGWDGAST
ncbi:hypothetical protein [Streptomyces sp. BRA346]|uniref:hypothetical protein n=1 Tax=Streptomyces sp. BRA346 TaxID=2878199 RepID=UPI0040649B02